MLRRLAAASLALLAACGSSDDRPDPPGPSTAALFGAHGAQVEILTSRELEEIARLEDQRSLGEGRLLEFAQSDRDARVRARAVIALGRLPYPAFEATVTETLVRALEDPTLDVRMEAAFALGVRGDPASAGTLIAYRNDPEPRLRARLVEAASKLTDPAIQEPITLSLRDSDLEVRMEAALGAARWDIRRPDAAEVDRALLDALSPYRITQASAPKSAVEAELVWRILWSLGRRKAELGRGPFLEYAGSAATLERLFALRGLAQLTPDTASVKAAVAALSGPNATKDWRCAYEATIALSRFAATPPSKLDERTREQLASKETLAALESVVEHPSAHVRAGAMEALASFGDERRVLALLQRGRVDVSVGVRAAAIGGLARVTSPDDALAQLRRGAREDDPVLRAAAADAAGQLRDGRAREVLMELTRDPSLFVSTRAVEQLGKHPSAAVRTELHRFLAQTDNGLRLAAVLALKSMPASEDVGPLIGAFRSSTGDGGPEVAFNVLQLLDSIGTDEARAVILGAQSDPRPFVSAVARKLVGETSRLNPSPLGTSPSERSVPIPGKDYPLYRFNPLVEINTTRGTMAFELFPAEAPIHVHNFLSLIERGAYNGLTFHRVVPCFVVQGGDYRGDGNGAQPWEGEALRAEFTARKTTRGSLGMPRNDDPDSGGSQFFVTHLPTPHLDGRYTFFGELRTGGNVLDQLEVGDRILSARVLD